MLHSQHRFSLSQVPPVQSFGLVDASRRIQGIRQAPPASHCVRVLGPQCCPARLVQIPKHLDGSLCVARRVVTIRQAAAVAKRLCMVWAIDLRASLHRVCKPANGFVKPSRGTVCVRQPVLRNHQQNTAVRINRTRRLQTGQRSLDPRFYRRCRAHDLSRTSALAQTVTKLPGVSQRNPKPLVDAPFALVSYHVDAANLPRVVHVRAAVRLQIETRNVYRPHLGDRRRQEVDLRPNQVWMRVRLVPPHETDPDVPPFLNLGVDAGGHLLGEFRRHILQLEVHPRRPGRMSPPVTSVP